MSTILDADRDGMVAALSSRARIENIPAAYAKVPALRDAWTSAFEKTRESLRGCVIAERKPRKVKLHGDPEPVEEEPVKKPTTKLKTMAAILAERHSDFT